MCGAHGMICIQAAAGRCNQPLRQTLGTVPVTLPLLPPLLQAIANIDVSTAQKALGQGSQFMSGLAQLDNTLACGENDPNSGACTKLNQQVYNK